MVGAVLWCSAVCSPECCVWCSFTARLEQGRVSWCWERCSDGWGEGARGAWQRGAWHHPEHGRIRAQAKGSCSEQPQTCWVQATPSRCTIHVLPTSTPHWGQGGPGLIGCTIRAHLGPGRHCVARHMHCGHSGSPPLSVAVHVPRRVGLPGGGCVRLSKRLRAGRSRAGPGSRGCMHGG